MTCYTFSDEPNSHVEATWENDNLLATISVPNEIYTVEVKYPFFLPVMTFVVFINQINKQASQN